MQWSENSNVFLGAEAQPVPVSSAVSARHHFEATNRNGWFAEITDSEVYVVSAVGLTLIPPNGGPQGLTWRPGRLGILGKDKSTRNIETLVCKDAGSWSAGENVAVRITVQKAVLKKKEDQPDLPNGVVPIVVSVHVPIA
jgi:hypothetical protein